MVMIHRRVDRAFAAFKLLPYIPTPAAKPTLISHAHPLSVTPR